MARKKDNTNLTELLLQCVTQPDPMLSMLEWLCTQLMEAEVEQQLGAGKSERADSRNGYRSGYRPRRLDTRMGTMYLMVPKVRQAGGLCTGCFHPENGKIGPESGYSEPVPQSGQ